MTRGNQRDLAREKNLKKQQQAAKSKNKDGLSVEKKMEKDAELLRQKQQKAMEKKEQEAQAQAKQTSKVVKFDPLKA